MSGQPHTLLVLDSAMHQNRQWLKLLLPVRPSRNAGWVRRDRVALGRTVYSIDIRTSRRQVVVYPRR